jgi:hypothetical protein
MGYKFRWPWAKDAGVREIFNGLVDAIKASCLGFLFQPILSLSSFEFVWVYVYLNNEYILNMFEFFFYLCLFQLNLYILLCLNLFGFVTLCWNLSKFVNLFESFWVL